MAPETRIETWLWSDPAFGDGPVERIDCVVERRSAGTLFLRYTVVGNIAEMVVPEPAPPLRIGNLWRTTCFELFLKAQGSTAYREFNFSPSTQWAAWEFAAYRDGMVQAPVAATPAISVTRTPDLLRLDVDLAVDLPDESCHLGLSAIVEGRGGEKAYWALNHGAPRGPDFHHPACFSAKLPPAPAE
jgi:hypothetical protein